jgi:hypothetical protein
MNRFSLLLATALLLLPLASRAADAPADPPVTPQAMYLQAGKLERHGEMAKARETYERLIDQFPASEFAVKANDRLLALPALVAAPPPLPAAAPTAVPSVPPHQQPTGIDALLKPQEPKPLPVDPLKRRGVELARRYQQAKAVYKDEIDRRQATQTTLAGHRVNRSVLADQQKAWERAAAERVRALFGNDLDTLKQQVQAVCDEARIAGECNEDAFIGTAPR